MVFKSSVGAMPMAVSTKLSISLSKGFCKFWGLTKFMLESGTPRSDQFFGGSAGPEQTPASPPELIELLVKSVHCGIGST